MTTQAYTRTRSMIRRKQLAALLLLLVCAWTLHPHWFDSLLDPDVPASERIHIVLTASGTYTLGLTALVNSTFSTASLQTRQRLHFHLISTTTDEAAEVVSNLKIQLGPIVANKFSLYGLDEASDPRLENVKVWAGYRAAALSQVCGTLREHFQLF